MRVYRISPITLICMALIVADSIMNNPYGSFREWAVSMVLALPGIIIALSFHEFAHAKVAELCGDDLPGRQGRVTINPAAHIDPFGFFCLLFIGFGWGRPVEINPENFKHKRRDLLLVSLAGVTMNLILAFLWTGVLVFAMNRGAYASDFGYYMFTMLQNLAVLNIVLCVFNIVPIPPLDGFNVITEIFNLRQTKFYHYCHQYGYIALMVFILFGVDYVLSHAVSWIYSLFLSIWL